MDSLGIDILPSRDFESTVCSSAGRGVLIATRADVVSFLTALVVQGCFSYSVSECRSVS